MKEPSGKAYQASGNTVHRYLLCVGISICNKMGFSFGVNYVAMWVVFAKTVTHYCGNITSLDYSAHSA